VVVSEDACRVSDQTGRRMLITGTRGLAYHVARALVGAGASVIMAGRDPIGGARAVESIQQDLPLAQVSFEPVDLACLASVAELAGRVAAGGALDVLINNAGIMSPPVRKTTADGFELQLGVNYLGHFALTGRLLPLLLAVQAPRVVSVTSLAHRHGRLDFDDLQREKSYRPGEAYCQSKLAQALFVGELQRRSGAAGWNLKSLGAHPGFALTNLFKNEPGARSMLNLFGRYVVGPLVGQSAARGAEPIVHAATASEVHGGDLYGPTGRFEMMGPAGRCEFAPRSLDRSVAERLWAASEKMTGVRYSEPPVQEAGSGGNGPGIVELV
jgi:NAD(P)-dependent dehydrogenase (short-subunit alcohol dehydrogenase family)